MSNGSETSPDMREPQPPGAEIIKWPYDQRELKRRRNDAFYQEHIRRTLGGQSIKARIINLPDMNTRNN